MSTTQFVNLLEQIQNASSPYKEYKKLYQESLQSPESFWGNQAERITWMNKWDKVKETCYQKPQVQIKWFQGAKLNASANCLDRHLETAAQKKALIWVPDNPQERPLEMTYLELYEEVCRMANVLRTQGVKKGDRVTIYMPMIPEAICSMLACARIGAIHSVVFGGFSPDALASRIIDCDSEFIITADEGVRGGKTIPLKKNVDEALKKCPHVKKVCVVKHTSSPIDWIGDRDFWYHEARKQVSTTCPPEVCEAEDPLFILYTSGSTGKPKGVLHTTGGYLVYASLTHEVIFNYKRDQVFWCTADIGWITGHSYVVYGPLANQATILIHEGVPTYPNPSRHFELIDEHQVDIYYTAPTAIRALMRNDDSFLNTSTRDSLKVLGTVGEPINPEAWKWYNEKVGKSQCPIVDTWWQTETGGILMSSIPGVTPFKPGFAATPFFGINPVLIDEEGQEMTGPGTGNLCIKDSWPGQMRTVYKDHERFMDTYFSQYENKYFTGDGALIDEEGLFRITGRVDDVLNVSGHRLGTAEIESALVEHPQISEAAVVGFPHDIKGEGIFAYVTLKENANPNDELEKDAINTVRKVIGPIATPDKILWTPSLPKTRSGKIMRRILRKIAKNEFEDLGDISTLADSKVVSELIEAREKI